MGTTKLTAATVETAPYIPAKAGWCVHWHAKLKGFGLRVTQSSARAYVVSYRIRGSRQAKLKTIGSLEKFTFGQAYDRAKEVLRAAEQGRDWFDENARKRAQVLGEVWTYYETEHLGSRDISPITLRDTKGLWKNHAEGDFKNRALADISAEVARDWHRRVTRDAGSYAANRTAQALRAAWNFGRKFGRVPRELENPFAAITLNREQPRQTILEPHQFPALAKALNAIENPWARAYLWLLFYTGCRRTELVKLQWNAVEILPPEKKKSRLGTILLKETKGREPRRVALSAPAVEILEGVPRVDDNPHVFVGHTDATHPAGRHLDPAPFWRTAREAAGLPELRMHDLRRSFGSWLGAQGVAPKLIGTVLGHKTDITSRVYVQLGEAAGIKRQLAETHAALAKEFAGGKKSK
jgi:integrase